MAKAHPTDDKVPSWAKWTAQQLVTFVLGVVIGGAVSNHYTEKRDRRAKRADVYSQLFGARVTYIKLKQDEADSAEGKFSAETEATFARHVKMRDLLKDLNDTEHQYFENRDKVYPADAQFLTLLGSATAAYLGDDEVTCEIDSVVAAISTVHWDLHTPTLMGTNEGELRKASDSFDKVAKAILTNRIAKPLDDLLDLMKRDMDR